MNKLKAKAKPAAADSNALQVVRTPEQTSAQAIARTALRPSINGASVVKAYQGNLLGKDVDLAELVDGLSDSCRRVKDGDLSTLEAMLVSQATALQTIFTSLARRAQSQEYQKNLEAFLGLALKAQAQSRATISALVDLKYPRQATFVKQANIAHGPQQVNNGAAAGADPEQYAQARTHAEKSAPEQNKLLEAEHGQPGQRMDTRAAQAAERGHHKRWKPWKQSTGPKSPEGKAAVSGNAWSGGEWLKLRQAIKALNQAMREQQRMLG